MPSAEEQARQQLEIQRQLQSRRGRSSLITPRPIGGGMFGNEDTTTSAPTITPLGSSLYGISNE